MFNGILINLAELRLNGLLTSVTLCTSVLLFNFSIITHAHISLKSLLSQSQSHSPQTHPHSPSHKSLNFAGVLLALFGFRSTSAIICSIIWSFPAAAFIGRLSTVSPTGGEDCGVGADADADVEMDVEVLFCHCASDWSVLAMLSLNSQDKHLRGIAGITAVSSSMR